MKAILIFSACCLSTVAFAGTDQIEFQVADPPLFQYEEATVAKPVKVFAKSIDGKCEGSFSLVGLQGGSDSIGGTLTGRVESGQCDGVPFTKAIVTGLSKKEGAAMLLRKSLFVVILN